MMKNFLKYVSVLYLKSISHLINKSNAKYNTEFKEN